MADDFDVLIGFCGRTASGAINEAEPAERRVLERVSDDIYLELRRRLGGKFTTTELADYYLTAGTDWCFEIAYTSAPELTGGLGHGNGRRGGLCPLRAPRGRLGWRSQARRRGVRSARAVPRDPH